MTAGRPTAVTVRPRVDVDLDAAAQALVAVHAVDGYPVEGVDDPHAWLLPEGMIGAWVAELDGRLVGHVILSEPQGEDAVVMWQAQSGATDTEIAVLARLFVHPDARGHSAGRQLTTAAALHAAKIGRRCVFDVMTKDTVAIQLYERLGCERLGETMHVFGDSQQVPAICYVAPSLSRS